MVRHRVGVRHMVGLRRGQLSFSQRNGANFAFFHTSPALVGSHGLEPYTHSCPSLLSARCMHALTAITLSHQLSRRCRQPQP